MSQHVQRSDGKLCGRVRTEPKVMPAEKKCSRCNRTKTAAEFSKSKKNSDLLDHWCKECRVEYGALWRDARKKDAEERMKAEGRKKAWQAYGGPMLVARINKLLDAAESARSTGLWQGREGLRAYRALGEMLEEFKRPLRPTAQDEEEGIVFYDADEEIFGARSA